MANETEKHSAGTYETKADANKSAKDIVKRRLRAIELASAEELEWRKDVEEAEKLYRAEKDNKAKGQNFNIYFSNIETLVPSLYNSTPVPDIRRRFGDADPIAKMGADILERALSQSIDDYDFDDTITDTIQDLAITSRGVARVRYEAGTGEISPGVEDVTYQTISCEHVPWNMYRRGPGKRWEDIPWFAFAHYMGREALKALSPEHGDKVNLDLTLDSSDKKKEDPDKPESDIFKRTLVWEIWDKEEKAVIFVAPSYPEHELAKVPDPLGLKGFFPIPRPMMGTKTSGKLTPICEYRIYKDLLAELDDITVRIRKLVKQLRPRVLVGAPAEAENDIERFAKADDNDVIFASKAMAFLDGGGLEKMLAWWPMDPIAKAIQALYERRDGVKQDIYEVVGLSDIMRGSVDPNEKLGQSQIKSQWGSLRTGRKQKDVQRFIRDLFRIKCEIICKHFTPQTLAMITGFNPDEPGPPQPGPPGPDGQPQMQPGPPLFPQALELLKQDAQRSYRIDIETDSTIRGDVTRNMEQMTQFVQGSGAYFQAMAPAVESGALPMEAAITIYSSFARQFRLGKEVEDLLDRLGQQAKQPQPPKPDPVQIKAEADAKMNEQKMQLEQMKGESKIAIEGQKLELDKQKHAAELQFKEQSAKLDLVIKWIESQQQQQMAEQEAGLRREEVQQNMILQAQEAHQNAALGERQAQQDMDLARKNAATQNMIARQKAKQQSKQQRNGK
jgi:hypothetical protein